MTIKMPERWFRAQSHGGTIRSGLMAYDGLVEADGSRMVGGFRIPPFQRDQVWTEEQSVKLVESIWDGFPIGSYTVNVVTERNPDTYVEADRWLLDGQQRWTAIARYVADEFPVRCSPHGEPVRRAFFSELDLVDKRNFMGFTFPMNETRNLTYDECLRVYDALAYGGTPHAPREEAPPPAPGRR